jgi:hypothetical protein
MPYPARADPTLFRNIKISSNNVGIKMKAFISRFISPNPTARLLRAREYIQIFSTKQIDDDAEEIPRFLACCTRLFSVCIWSVEMRPSFFDLSIPTLKRLSFSRFVSTMDLSFQLPIFRSVTHLDLTPIPFDRWNELWDANLSFIPNLTHLALDFSEDPAYFNEIIPTISSNITLGIQVVILFVPTSAINSITADHNPHIALGDTRNAYDQVWATFSEEIREENGIWRKAEIQLQEREQKRSDETQT